MLLFGFSSRPASHVNLLCAVLKYHFGRNSLVPQRSRGPACHRHCFPVRLSRVGCSFQFGRTSTRLPSHLYFANKKTHQKTPPGGFSYGARARESGAPCSRWERTSKG